MSQSKGTLRNIVGLPVATIGAILNAESDWIRYGLPAFLLTVIFFFAMRHDSPPEPAVVGVASSFQSRPNPVNQPAMPQNSLARNLTMTIPPSVSAVPPQQSVVPNPPSVQGTTPQQLEAIHALCTATRLAANVPAIRRKATVLRYAVSGYKGAGPGGFQIAAR